MTIGDVVVDANDTPDAAASSVSVIPYKNDTYASVRIERPEDGFGITLHFRDDRLNVAVVGPLPSVENELDARRLLREMEAVIEPVAPRHGS